MFKKYFCLFITINVIAIQLNLVAYADQVIEDEIIQAGFKSKNISKPVYKPSIIEDESVEKSFKNKTLSKPLIVMSIIEDETVKEQFKNKDLSKPVFKDEVIEDEFALGTLDTANIARPVYKQKFITETDTSIAIIIGCKSKIATNQADIGDIRVGSRKLDVGDKVNFKVLNNVIKNGELFIAKDTKVDAIVGNITPSSKAGAPAELTVERFITTDINGNKVELTGNIIKKGANLTPLVYLLAYGGYPFSFGLSILALYIPGGQAVIGTQQKFTLYIDQ